MASDDVIILARRDGPNLQTDIVTVAVGPAHQAEFVVPKSEANTALERDNLRAILELRLRDNKVLEENPL